MQTQTDTISNYGIEVIELEIEEIEIEGLSDEQHCPDEPIVQNQESQYQYSLNHQKVA
jgi:hypothetical protein